MTAMFLLKFTILFIIGLILIPVSRMLVTLGSGVWWASRLVDALKPEAKIEVGRHLGNTVYAIDYKRQKVIIQVMDGSFVIRAFGQRFNSFDDLFKYSKDHPDVENPFDKDPLKG